MSKYRNKKVTVDGIPFDSLKEARRYGELKLTERAGLITNLQRQVSYLLIPTQFDENNKVLERSCVYRADFQYLDTETGKTVVEDVKGKRTKEYIIKRKLMLEKYGIRIKEA